MDLLHATILGLVEGLTEFIPVSSTGHLILTNHWLGLPESEGLKAFDVVVQAGAWLACVLFYWPVLQRRLQDLRATDEPVRLQARRLLLGVAVAFVPIAVVGKLAGKAIKAKLFNPTSVAVALAVGGVLMLVLERVLAKRAKRTLDEVTLPTAIAVGVAQCAALLPGTSRSMATILGGMATGLQLRSAADFSFLVAIPVLGAATAYELLKEWHVLITDVGAVAMTVGLIASFLSGWAAIALLLQVLARYGLAPFGIYRLALAALVWFELR
jgi:undecaprenyl-diphosphatase